MYNLLGFFELSVLGNPIINLIKSNFTTRKHNSDGLFVVLIVIVVYLVVKN